MTNAFAPRPIEDFEDEFDLDAGYTAASNTVPMQDPAVPAAFPGEAPLDQRPPLQFTAPTGVAVAQPAAPQSSPFSPATGPGGR